MTKHIIDQRKPATDSGRLSKFTAVAKTQGGPHPASMELLKRTGATENGERTKHFARIDRGQEA